MQKVTNDIERLHTDCPIKEILALIGDKWSLEILYILHSKERRFNELKKAIGNISQRVLTQRLRNLERDGYITRTVYPVSPPKVEYTLTELGISIFGPISQMEQWARRSRSQILENRNQYDKSTES